MTDFLTKKGWLFPNDNAAFITRAENNVAGDPIYIGRALAGTAESDAGWQIKKVTYDGSDFFIADNFAEGTNGYDKVWNDRAGYTYS